MRKRDFVVTSAIKLDEIQHHAYRHTILLNECVLLRNNDRLRDFFFGENSYMLNETSLRHTLGQVKLTKWKQILDEIQSSINNNEFDAKQTESEIQPLVTLALKATAEVNTIEYLKATLELMKNLEKVFPFCTEMKFKRNHSCLVRAAIRNDLQLVRILFQYGFRISSALAFDYYGEKSIAKLEILSELRYFEALTSPSYLLSEWEIRKNVDPIKKAFNHLETCKMLRSKMKAHVQRLFKIESTLKEFIYQMLDLCDGLDEVRLFLDQDDDIESLNVKAASSMLPRILEAIQVDHKKFVTHDGCQQVIRRTFYGYQYERMKSAGALTKIIVCLMQWTLAPVYIAITLWSKLFHAGDVEKLPKWLKGYQVPLNRSLIQFGSYLCFLIWIILTFVNPNDVPDHIDVNVNDTLAAIWALGYLVSDIQSMFYLSDGARAKTSKSFFALFVAKVKRFFSSNFLNFRLLSHLIYFVGICIEGGGYVLSREDADERDCPIDDPRAYSGFSSVKVGICLQGIAIVMIFTHIFQVLRLHVTIGSLYVAIRTCLGIVISFTATYAIINIAFALGIHFILRHSNEVCDNDGNPIHLTCNETVFLQQKNIGLYCELENDPNGNRVYCPSPCWRSWIQNPENRAFWEQECRNEKGELMVPHAQVKHFIRGEVTNFGDLGDERNRFTTFRSAMNTLLWSLFDPGHPEVVGCSTGAARYAALLLWLLYNTILVIILLNLLIALMNVAMTDIVEHRVSSWKYHRTEVWMESCTLKFTLPPPFNLLSLILDLVVSVIRVIFWQCSSIPELIFKNEVDGPVDRKQEQYHELLEILVAKYLKTSVTNDDHSQISLLRRELRDFLDQKKCQMTDAQTQTMNE